MKQARREDWACGHDAGRKPAKVTFGLEKVLWRRCFGEGAVLQCPGKTSLEDLRQHQDPKACSSLLAILLAFKGGLIGGGKGL